MTTKRSFFDRLSGGLSTDESLDSFDDEQPVAAAPTRREAKARASEALGRPAPLDDDAPAGDGQLPVDVHQTGSDIIIRAFVAGVRPDELTISISRDMVEIGGSRLEREQVSTSDYFTRELFWGSFSRTILLPQEIDVEASTATAKTAS